MSFDAIVMQSFTGLSIFTVLMLMALGLTIIFGLMGVINMAHGELMLLGAYCTYGTAKFFQAFFPAADGRLRFRRHRAGVFSSRVQWVICWKKV